VIRKASTADTDPNFKIVVYELPVLDEDDQKKAAAS
jgi:hypothetical protein